MSITNENAGRPFSVVTYNILADAYIKPGRYENVSPAALEPSARRALLGQHLIAMDADVYCLQEVEPGAYDHICGLLGEDYAHTFVQKEARPEGCATWVRRSAFEKIDFESFATNLDGEPQVVAIAHLVTLDALALTVANTHLRWQPPRTSRDDHLGRKHLLQLLERRRSGASTWILAGDFNAISESVVLQAVLERGFEISCRTQRPWDTANFNGRRRKLDYLLFEPGRLTPRPGTLPQLERDTPLPSATQPSDHLALRVEFSGGQRG